MVKKLKNNEGVDISFIGVIVIMIMITVICMFFDIFISSVAKNEAQQIIEFAELYSLIDTVDTHLLRDGILYIDTINARKVLKQQVDKHIKTGAGSYFNAFEITNISYTYNEDSLSFVDNQSRKYVRCSVSAEYLTNQYFSNGKKKVKIQVDTRLFLHL